MPETNKPETIRLQDLLRESEQTIRRLQRFIPFGNQEAQTVSNEASNLRARIKAEIGEESTFRAEFITAIILIGIAGAVAYFMGYLKFG